MNNKKLLLICAILLLLLTGITNCENDDKDMVTGSVLYFAPPDNCNDYMIKIDNKIYKPKTLENQYKVDGLKVRLSYRITNEQWNCGFGGYQTVIEILKIEKL